MKLAKVFISMALFFSVALVGIGFAAVSTNLFFSGSIDFQHTSLYISNITSGSGVTVQGYSGTLLNLTAAAGSTMTVSITNPTDDTYYYLNYTAGDHSLTLSGIALGSGVNPKETISFTVTFPESIEHTHAVKFNFTLVPPYIPPDNPEDSDPDNPSIGDGTNATAALEFVINDVRRGLNSKENKHTFRHWVNESNRVRYCLENNVPGGNLGNEFPAIGAGDILFMLEWVNATQYNIYLYFSSEADNNEGKYITVYKQEIIYNSIDSLWTAADSYKGYAMATSEKNGPGIEVVGQNSNEHVVWYANENDLPAGAVIA